MTFKFTAQRVDNGAVPTSQMANVTTRAQINQTINGRDIITDTVVLTDAQLSCILCYIRACGLGTNTSSVETAIIAII